MPYAHLEKARELVPEKPAVYSNLPRHISDEEIWEEAQEALTRWQL